MFQKIGHLSYIKGLSCKTSILTTWQVLLSNLQQSQPQPHTTAAAGGDNIQIQMSCVECLLVITHRHGNIESLSPVLTLYYPQALHTISQAIQYVYLIWMWLHY